MSLIWIRIAIENRNGRTVAERREALPRCVVESPEREERIYNVLTGSNASEASVGYVRRFEHAKRVRAAAQSAVPGCHLSAQISGDVFHFIRLLALLVV
jgi:hypothetical protein